MFAIVVRLKEGHAQVKFEEDAADGPDVARLRPTQFYSTNRSFIRLEFNFRIVRLGLTENDFGCAVVTRRDDGAVMFVVESGAAKVNQPHVRPFHSPVIPFLLSAKRKKKNKQMEQKVNGVAKND